MKVLTLKQPWATLVAEGIKKYEFRTWKTNYRGKLLIHAGVGIDKEELEKFKKMNLNFSKKSIIAIVDLVDCIEIDENLNNQIINENNIAYESKKRTGYAWKFENIKTINFSKEIKGQLGIWNIEIKEEELYEC